MSLTQFKSSLLVGVALFSIFFGAGNIIFPVALGVHVAPADMPLALCGLLSSLVLLPMLGVLSFMFYFLRNPQLPLTPQTYFADLGQMKHVIILITGAILGFIAGPRCVIVSAESLNAIMPNIPSSFNYIFSLCYCLLGFLCCIKPSKLLDIIAKYLTPIFLVILGVIFVMGFMAPHPDAIIPFTTIEPTALIGGAADKVTEIANGVSNVVANGVVNGVAAVADVVAVRPVFTTTPVKDSLLAGFSTLDLIGIHFFVILGLNKILHTHDSSKARTAVWAAIITAIFMAVLYVPLILLSQKFSVIISGTQDSHKLLHIVRHAIGENAVFLFSLAICLACFTTFVALIDTTANLISHYTLIDKRLSLMVSTILCYAISLVSFDQLQMVLMKIILLIYPALAAYMIAKFVDTFMHQRVAKYAFWTVLGYSTLQYVNIV